MVEFSTADFISPAPPLGIRTSIYSFIFINLIAVSLEVSSIIEIESSGKPDAASAFLNDFTRLC